jgi:hypothetical protein
VTLPHDYRGEACATPGCSGQVTARGQTLCYPCWADAPSREETAEATRIRRLDADYLDPIEARDMGATALQLAVVEARNEHSSWRAIARHLGVSVRTVREAWGEVNRRVRGGAEVRPIVERDGADIGDRELLRGIPALGGPGALGGAIRGTRPGDPAWRAQADASLPRARRPKRGA